MASNENARINKLNEDARFFGGEDAPQLDIYDVRTVINEFNRKCLDPDCPTPDVPATSPDHVIPLALGGENILENLQLLHVNCNKKKGDKHLDFRNGRILTQEDKAKYLPATKELKEAYKKHDWEEIEADYIYGDFNMRELAKLYNVSFRQLTGVAAENEWVKKRQTNSVKIASQIRQEIEAMNVQEGFSTYKAFYISMRRAFDDYMAFPDPEKLRALNDLFGKGLVMEGRDELNTKKLVMKDWRDVADDQAPDLDTFATETAARYYSGGDSGEDSTAGAGWTD